MYYSARGSTPTVVAAAKGGVCKSALPAYGRIAGGNFGPPPKPSSPRKPETTSPRKPETTSPRKPRPGPERQSYLSFLYFIFTSPVLTLRDPGSIELPCTVITSRPSTEFE